MNFVNKIKILTTINLKYRRSTQITSPVFRFIHRFQAASSQRSQNDVITNLCEKLCCTEDIAKIIYIKFPSLRCVDAIRNDTLKWLRDRITLQSIAENPSLVTMDINSLQKKIDLLNLLKPRVLDDFAPLLIMDESALNMLVERLLREKNDIEQGNRIYFLSEMLQVEPKVIAKYRVNCGYEIFHTPFPSYRKKLNIVLDYGMGRLEILNGLYALRYDDNIFIQRSEQMISVGIPIKMWYYQQSEVNFNKMIKRHTLKEGTHKSSLSSEIAKNLKKLDLQKATIIETLKSTLHCDDSESLQIYYNHVSEISELATAKGNIDYLLEVDVSRETITANGFLLRIPHSEIRERLGVLKEMKPKNINDFIPLMRIDVTELHEYRCMLEKDNSIGFNHPIYYFSEKLNIAISVVAAQFAENKEMFLESESKMLKSKLDVLQKYNVEPLSILNDPMAFKYSVNRIEELMCQLKSRGLDKTSSWMIYKAGSGQIDKMILGKTRDKKTLEGFHSNTEYVAQRLNWNESDLRVAVEKYPSIVKRSTSKIQEQLDYFLNETQFTAQDIKNAPYILTKNLNEVKIRINEMTGIGATFTLSMIYQGKSNYLKCIREFLATKENDEASRMAFLAIELRLKSQKTEKKANS